MIWLLDDKTALAVLAITLVIAGLCISFVTKRLLKSLERIRELEENYIADDYEWLKLIAEQKQRKEDDRK
jgi:hypothetical protein